MKKEMIISVLVGLFFGLIIVYGVYTAQNSLTKNDQDNKQLETTPSPNPSDQADANLAIHNPEDEIIVDEALITITGTTTADNYVVIFINDDEIITTADEAGSFSVEGELELGSNIVQVHAIDENGQTTVKERTVIYSTRPLVEPTPEDEIATDSASTSEEQ